MHIGAKCKVPVLVAFLPPLDIDLFAFDSPCRSCFSEADPPAARGADAAWLPNAAAARLFDDGPRRVAGLSEAELRGEIVPKLELEGVLELNCCESTAEQLHRGFPLTPSPSPRSTGARGARAL